MTAPEVKTYPSERAALRRVAELKGHGIWAGLVRVGERWRLTCDPDTGGTRAHRPTEEPTA